jgi:hypothetical protein
MEDLTTSESNEHSFNDLFIDDAHYDPNYTPGYFRGLEAPVFPTIYLFDIVKLLSSSEEEKWSFAHWLSDDEVVPPDELLECKLRHLVDELIRLPLERSLRIIDEIISLMEIESKPQFIELLILGIHGSRISMQTTLTNDFEKALIRLDLLERYSERKFFSSHSENILISDLKVSQVVELGDALHFYSDELRKRYSRIHIHKALGHLFNVRTTDESYKNTSCNNMKREKDKFLFLNSLIRKFEKAITLN